MLPNGHIKCPRFYPKKRVLLNGLRPAVRSLKRSLKNEDVPPMRYGRAFSGRTERDVRTPCRRPTAKALSAAFLQEIRKKASAPNGLAGSTPARGIRETSRMEELDMGQVLQWIFLAGLELVLMVLTAGFIRVMVYITYEIIENTTEF